MSLTDLALAHRFDLLGSGWVEVRHAMACTGFEGHQYTTGQELGRPSTHDLVARVNAANQPQAAQVRSLVSAAYQPIDWHLDFRSGYRWDEATWYRDVKIGHIPGADVKVPWELGRLQHLPRLALAALLAADEVDIDRIQRLADEFRDQVLDFIASNPPRFGVQWVTAMDVGIRVANLLVAWDLFSAAGPRFDESFESVFRASIFDHGQHIASNLEWSEDARGNHYLADLTGLLFAASYLGPGPASDTWLRFAAREVIAEIRRQFLDDGGNFEGSTSYHRLSAELATYSVALLLALPEPRVEMLSAEPARGGYEDALPGGPLSSLPTWVSLEGRRFAVPVDVLDRLGRVQAFTMNITKPNGRVPQIGDNDNGRLFDLVPIVARMDTEDARRRYRNLEGSVSSEPTSWTWMEDHLDHRALMDAIDGLLGRTIGARGPSVDHGIVAGLAKPLAEWARLGASGATQVRVGDEGAWRRFDTILAALPRSQRRDIRIELPGSDPRIGQHILGYPAFGLYILRSERLYVAVRCGPVGQNGRGGHDHNDQLALELMVDGIDWIRDPGTYVYTALPELRDMYRSVRAHFAPQLEGPEPARLDLGMFQLGTGGHASCLYWGEEGFAGRLRAADGRVAFCRIRLTEAALEVTHAAERGGLSRVESDSSDWRAQLPDIAYSPGYGIVER